MTDPLHPALAGLHDVDWAALHGAYGSAADVPRLLADTASDDPQTVRDAVFELFGTIYHQGTVYEVSAHAVPFLVSLAESEDLLDRGSPAQLLWAIADSEDATDEVLARIRGALAAQATRLLALAADPDQEVRLFAALTVGLLKGADPVAAGEVLADRLHLEGDPQTIAVLITSRAQVAPGDWSWLSGWEGPEHHTGVRAAALRAHARSPLPWSGHHSRAVAEAWGRGDPHEEWMWTDETLTGLVVSLYADRPEAVVGLLRLLVEGSAEAAVAGLDLAHRMCARSRSARPGMAAVLAAGLAHPDPDVRRKALPLVADVVEAAALVADELAALTTGGLAPAREMWLLPGESAPAWYAVLALLRIGDPRWLDPVLRALESGPVPILAEVVHLRPERSIELLPAVRARLTGPAGLAEGLPVDAGDLFALLVSWGERSRPALPELLAMVRQIPSGLESGPGPERFTRLAAGLGTDLPELPAALREQLGGYADRWRAAAMDPGNRNRYSAASLLHEVTGETELPLALLAAELRENPHLIRAQRLAARLGPDGLGIVDLLPEWSGPHSIERDLPVTLARVTGDTGPLFTAAEADLRRGVLERHTEEYLDGLGAAAVPLLPELRRLRDGDAPVQRSSVIYGADGAGAVTGDRDAVALLDAHITRIEGEVLP